ncbi:hypothetical protein ACFVRR_12565 [Gottfriedia sp. NPDC057948]|uniref:hypothetical protein n=1 Tax=Gottfriedia sp. NPDC057948 TaxID=3346287 RepID=UPI0036D7A462
MKKNKLLLFCCILLIALLSGCNSSTKKTTTKLEHQKSMISNLEGTNKTEKNYLFFNENDNTKNITLSFYNKFDKTPISSVILYKNDLAISNTLEAINSLISEGGKFVFKLYEYVPFFNKVEFLDIKGKSILKLHTGDYYLKKINIPNNINENQLWQIDGFKTDDFIQDFTFNATFSRKEPINDHFQLLNTNDEFNKPFNINENHNINENKKILNFNYTMKTDETKKGSYEILLIQKNNQHQQSILNSIVIPITH